MDLKPSGRMVIMASVGSILWWDCSATTFGQADNEHRWLSTETLPCRRGEPVSRRQGALAARTLELAGESQVSSSRAQGRQADLRPLIRAVLTK